jgi:hypothetical protein
MDLAMTGDKAPVIPEFLAGGGEMGLRIREFDWSGTSLGPVEPDALSRITRVDETW